MIKRNLLLKGLLPILVMLSCYAPGSIVYSQRASSSVQQIQQTSLLPETVVQQANLRYFAGPVMTGTVNVYVIFWEPASSFVSPAYNGLILRYFADIGTSKLYHNLIQYRDENGAFPVNSTLADTWVDTTPYYAPRLGDPQMQREIVRAMQLRGWRSAANHLFFVFTSKNENVCTGNACGFIDFCGYHSAIGQQIPYAVVPYAGTNLAACGVPSSPNNDIDADSAISVASHEQMEAVTDPYENGWVDPSGDEVADKCEWNFGDPIVINGDQFLVQKEWDNMRSACMLTGP